MNGGHFWWLHNLYIPRVVASAIFSVGYFTPGAILPLDFFLCISVLFRAGSLMYRLDGIIGLSRPRFNRSRNFR